MLQRKEGLGVLKILWSNLIKKHRLALKNAANITVQTYKIIKLDTVVAIGEIFKEKKYLKYYNGSPLGCQI